MINTTGYSFASQAYPDDVEKVISIMEATVGAGMMIGPILGSSIYNVVGFFKTFAIFGIAMAPISLIVLFALPTPLKVRRRVEGWTESELADMDEIEIHS